MATESTAGYPQPRVVRLRTPLTEESVRDLRAGDEVWPDGTVWGARDASLIHFFDDDQRPAADFHGAAFIRTAPSVRVGDKVGYVPVSVGTTTSLRMDRFTLGCLEQLGARAIIGKGGLSTLSLSHFQDLGGVYLSITGGAASWQTLQIEEIEKVL